MSANYPQSTSTIEFFSLFISFNNGMFQRILCRVAPEVEVIFDETLTVPFFTLDSSFPRFSQFLVLYWAKKRFRLANTILLRVLITNLDRQLLKLNISEKVSENFCQNVGKANANDCFLNDHRKDSDQ